MLFLKVLIQNKAVNFFWTKKDKGCLRSSASRGLYEGTVLK